MRPESLRTRIFIDGGDSAETRETISLLGFLDGQTTNPTLISKNPRAKARIERGEKFSEEEALGFYREVVNDVSGLLPRGAISIEVYADPSTTSEQMLRQGREMFSWIPNAHVKFPSSREGLKAAEQAVKEGLRVNNTLCFSQEQAAAVYAATKGAKKGDVFVSPFVGRLDDMGENGMDLIAHIIKMYKKGDGHVELLTASVRSLGHLLCAIRLGSDIVTAPYGILKEWGEKGCPMPGDEYVCNAGVLKSIPYRDIDLSRKWQDYDIGHELTVKGMEKFSADWNALIK
ncbi:MAG: transaldolase family protein [Nitrospirota bacterium]